MQKLLSISRFHLLIFAFISIIRGDGSKKVLWFMSESFLPMSSSRGFIVSNLTFRRRQWHPTPVLLPGKSYGWRSLVGCSPWGGEESDMTERLHFHFSLLCIGEGNGNPLQCSCLENPRDGVAQSWTWLKWLSSSSNLTFRSLIHFEIIFLYGVKEWLIFIFLHVADQFSQDQLL